MACGSQLVNMAELSQLFHPRSGMLQRNMCATFSSMAVALQIICKIPYTWRGVSSQVHLILIYYTYIIIETGHPAAETTN